MNCLDEFNVELLWFGELVFVGGIKVDSSSKSTIEMTDTVRDASVRMEEVRRKLEEEVLAKYGV